MSDMQNDVNGDGIAVVGMKTRRKRRRAPDADIRVVPVSVLTPQEQDNTPQRTPKGRWKPGSSGNPRGRPPKRSFEREGRRALDATISLELLNIRRGFGDGIEVIAESTAPIDPADLEKAVAVAVPLVGTTRAALCAELFPHEFCRACLEPPEVEPKGKARAVEDQEGQDDEAKDEVVAGIERLAETEPPKGGYWLEGGPKYGIWRDENGNDFDFRPARFRPTGHDETFEWRPLPGYGQGGGATPGLLRNERDDGMLH